MRNHMAGKKRRKLAVRRPRHCARTLAGHNFVGRMGASFLRTLGRPEWVVADRAGYVAAALRSERSYTRGAD